MRGIRRKYFHGACPGCHSRNYDTLWIGEYVGNYREIRIKCLDCGKERETKEGRTRAVNARPVLEEKRK